MKKKIVGEQQHRTTKIYSIGTVSNAFNHKSLANTYTNWLTFAIAYGYGG